MSILSDRSGSLPPTISWTVLAERLSSSFPVCDFSHQMLAKMGAHKIHEDADLWRYFPIAGPHQVDSAGVRHIGSQHGFQASICDRVLDRKIRHACDPTPRQGHMKQRVQAVAYHRQRQRRACRRECRMPQRPLIESSRGGPAIVQTCMMQKVIRLRGHSLSFQVRWRGHQTGAPATQWARYQARISKRAPTNDDVKSFIDYVDQSIIEIKIKFNLGIALHECRKHWQW